MNYPPLGNSDGTDCSGLCQWSYNANGIKISRTTYTQIKEGFEVKESELKPGDLIFMHFTSPNTPQHVFMYSGEKDGKHMCVEAPHTGLNIRERAFTWESGYRVRRIIKDTSNGGNTNGICGTKASANIIYYVKGIEGFAPNIYRDEVGVRTLGYGMTGGELNGISTPLSETAATAYLTNNFNRDYYTPVYNILNHYNKKPLQREMDAFVSFAYNLGVECFRNSTVLKAYLNGASSSQMRQEFAKYCHAGGVVSKGLVRRRDEEWKIFSGSSEKVGGYNCRPEISYIGTNGRSTGKLVSENGGYGAKPY